MVMVGSLLALEIANFFMEDFEESTLSRAAYKTCCCFQNTDNTFVISPHGPENKTSTIISTAYIATCNSQERLRKMATSHIWILVSTDLMASWVI
jgi:hypothetical protein